MSEQPAASSLPSLFFEHIILKLHSFVQDFGCYWGTACNFWQEAEVQLGLCS